MAWWGGSNSVPAFWLWLRLAVIAAVPLLIVEPLQATDWALAIEKLWPKAREAQSGIFDPGSKAVRKAKHGMNLRKYNGGNGGGDGAEAQTEEATPNDPDTTQTMRVDGV